MEIRKNDILPQIRRNGFYCIKIVIDLQLFKWYELLLVVLNVVGSNPTSHPQEGPLIICFDY